MYAIDIILLAIVIIAAVTGAMRGMVMQIGTIAALLAAILVCRFFGASVVHALVSPGSEHATALTVGIYVLLFLAVYIGVILLAKLLGATMSAVHLRPFDRVAGALFRIAAWLIVCSVLLNAYFAVCPTDKSRFTSPSKPWRGAVVKIAPALMGYISNPDA